ncbi:hypothetical protein ABFX02_09G046600 [Erythranthe guttata]
MVKIPLIQREIAWTRDFVVRRQVATQSSLFMVVAGRVIKTTMEKWMRYDGNVLRIHGVRGSEVYWFPIKLFPSNHIQE